MSLAGVRSNRGDHYQTLVAFDWALSILADNAYQWLEVDSTSFDANGKPISVDDVVIGCADGSLIACQCKKNQPDFKPWSIADLGNELTKAARLLAAYPSSQVKFYSRNNFGALAKLCEHARNVTGDAYQRSLTADHRKTDAALAKHLIGTSGLTTYNWLLRTSFEVSNDFERAQELLKERLRALVSNADSAFDALWAKLDKLGSRVGDGGSSALPSHRLNKADLITVLEKFGATLVPPISQQQMQQALAEVSAVGRSWRRDIFGTRLHVDTVDELMTAIASTDRSILLSGIPGSGKTCALLELQEALEQRNDLAAAFIQTREYANCLTPEARSAHGLPADLVGLVARMADNKPVVLIIDSLDVLSLSREHVVLDFFLALIDRLLLIPKVTVIAACREFDRKYDRRLAERSWDKVVNTQALNWQHAVAPIINAFGIDPQTLDSTTQSLLQNPRELAMFADIAQQTGGFNVASSQALSRKYLEIVVQNDWFLGDAAMAALEKIADKMVKSRKLDIAPVQAALPDEMRKRLLSANVLHENQSGNIEFGHQTLLDVLVVSGAQRNELTLKAFIEQLPPVPFVRPTIRAYVTYLAAGDRSTLRKQLRAVFDSEAAFHFRRLVAESLAELVPQNDDWSLLKHLHSQHRELFTPLYYQSSSLEWHRFWLNFLIPHLLQQRDAQSLTLHVQRIGLWKNADPKAVVAFWTFALQQEWADREQLADNVKIQLHDFDFQNETATAALIETLLTYPGRDHDFLGRAIARCVEAGGADDTLLWRYIAGEILPDDVLAIHFNQKLRCDSHEFDNQGFFENRMQQSERLLDLAIGAVEQWSAIKTEHYNGNRELAAHFLNFTSYEHTHSQHDTYHVSAENVLFGAMEKAILLHAKQNSNWWQVNRQKLCHSREMVLRYLALLALIESPEANLTEISALLTNQGMLASNLSYELGNLIHAAFVFLQPTVQDAVESAILTLWNDHNLDENHWILGARVQLLASIPVYLRSPTAQTTLLEWEKAFGPCIRQPHIGSRGGIVGAPFSYLRFLEFSDAGVLQLLKHYRNDTGRDWGDDFLIGGAEQVEWQLREAASRSPHRFMRFLAEKWVDIPERFTNDILEGAASFLLYRYGNHGPADNQWQPIEQVDPQLLATLILDEIERHPSHWRHSRAAAEGLEACANVIENERDAFRLVFAAIGFFDLHERSYNDDRDLIGAGINMIRGKVAEAVMIVATCWTEKQRPYPELLLPTLRRFASDSQPAIRALILRRLPYLQSQSPELGWELFHLALDDDEPRLWKEAEPCLYYAYHQRFAEVAKVLQRLVSQSTGEPLETWGRISALAAFVGYIDFQPFIHQLETLASTDAWKGAATVWTHKDNYAKHAQQCLAGIRAGLSQSNEVATTIARELSSLFDKEQPPICISWDIVDLYFSAYEQDRSGEGFHLYGFDEWLNALSQSNPDESLATCERFAAFMRGGIHPVYDCEPLSQLLTRLFREAEEREESDDGQMLSRVIALQDAFLAIGVNGLQDWLRDAERP